MSEKVQYERLGAVSRVTLDDGKVNSLSPDMLGQIERALDQAEADGTVAWIRGREAASALAALDRTAHAQTKPRTRKLVLEALRVAIESELGS